MCTVAYLPASPGYMLAHNRDERWSRGRARPPHLYRRGGRAFLAPRDPEGGGTWIAVNDGGWTFCILNAGAAATHPRRPVISRGRLVWSVAHLRDARELEHYLPHDELVHVRPFELLAVGPARAPRILRVSWDGRRMRWRTEPAHRPRLFVASTLVEAGIGAARRRRWRRFLDAHPHPTTELLARWLASHGRRGPGAWSVCMHDTRAGTVSRTLVEVGRSDARMSYREGPPCRPEARERTRSLHLRQA